MRFTCAICGEEITATNDSDEHIIPASIGGRRTVRRFLHQACNNKAGETWDAELAKQLQPLALHFGVKRQSGQALRMKILTSADEEFLLGPEGSLAISKPLITKVNGSDKTTYKITVGSESSARKVLNGLKRKHPKIDVEETLASAQMTWSYAKGVFSIDMKFGGDKSGRSLVKSTLALAKEAEIPIDLCTDAVGYLRYSAPPCFGYYFVRDLIAERPAATPLHCIAIEATPDTGLILGYAEYFGVHRAVVCLGRGYKGKAVRATYALDPRTGTQLNLNVNLSFNEANIEEIYDYKMDDVTGRQAAFGAVFGPYQQEKRKTEWECVVKEALNYAWLNCGATPNTFLTIADKLTIIRLFGDKAIPFLTQVQGWDAQFARHYAESVACQILNLAASDFGKLQIPSEQPL
ncbi:HNH endonuclease [Acetobacter cibinongensis]|uniref:HNH endonuclease 5 domain-containing protein n=1 Tax=Acetobacter cibinongensis TaxID=146475 RepID=A0A1Z5YS16_9PROT|nr:HNH endonuclease [Acetobacter cibinongensis]OUJ00532.1 hypothetical protein HK14_12190 [Acetobacter cibinongensis]